MIRRPRRGFSMIEAIVASAITLMVLTASGMSIAGAQKAVAAAATRDRATSIALSILEQSAALGCGSAVLPSRVTSGLQAACASAYGSPTGVGVSAGDGTATQTDTEGRTYNVSVSTRWLQPGYDDMCLPPAAGVSPLLRTRPALLLRSVNLTWNAGGVAQDQQFDSVTAVPSGADYETGNAGGIVAYAAPGTVVTLQQSGIAAPIHRIATACSGGAAAGAAWFPYLTPGTYLVGTNGQTGASVAVSAGAVTEVTR